ncbi:hypothetical protein M885DRAFT_557917 [Pelagophyceae sp. CCMP2097]|nr:hypothetical protein M885DRAFT_557917 [Pelagophyceae sp. CCMP2097]
MAPKKKKVGDGVGGADAASTREQKRKLQELELDGVETRKLLERLGRERAAKMKELALAEAAVQRAKIAASLDAAAVEAMRAAAAERLGAAVGRLDVERCELEIDLGAAAPLKAQNDRLRAEVYALRRAAQGDRDEQAAELARVKHSAFELRMRVEGLSRHALRDVDAEYKAAAHDDVRGQALRAAASNNALVTDLDGRSRTCVDVLAAEQGAARALRLRAVEVELLESAKDEHEQRVDRLRDARDRADRQASQHEARICDAQAALEAAQADERRAVSAAQNLDDVRARIAAAALAAKRHRHRALALARTLERYADADKRASFASPRTPTRPDLGEAAPATLDRSYDDTEALDMIAMWNSKIGAS